MRSFAFRRVFLVPALLAAVLASGCMTIADPVVSLEQSKLSPVPLKNVLVVVDYKLDVEATGGSARREAFRHDFYAPIAETMAEAVRTAGGTPTIAFVTDVDHLATVGPEYSHVWVQRIYHLTRVSGSGGVGVENLRWKGTLAHRPSPGAALVHAYEMNYRSDGFRCSGMQVFAGKEECRVKVKALLESQLKKYLAGS